MKVRIARYTLNGLLALLAISTVAFATYNFLVRYREPVKIVSASAQSVRILPGKPLIINYFVIRERLCRTDIDRFLIRSSDGVVVWRDRGPGGSSPLGPAPFRADVNIPRIAPGDYLYRAFWQSDCEGGQYTTPSPDVPFEVISDGQT